MPLFIISIVVQLFLVIHIIKTGRNTTWIWIIVLIPLVGSLAYIFIEILPDITNTRTGRKASKNLKKVINPDKDLNEAVRKYGESSTVENSANLAEECFSKRMYQEARDLYEKTLNGAHASEPDLMYGLAKCDFELRNFVAAKDILDSLIEKNPDYKNQDAHLLYARTLENIGDDISARHEYEALHEYFSGPVASYYYAKFLKSKNEVEKAEKIFNDIIHKAKASGRHYNDLYRDYINKAYAEIHN